MLNFCINFQFEFDYFFFVGGKLNLFSFFLPVPEPKKPWGHSLNIWQSKTLGFWQHKKIISSPDGQNLQEPRTSSHERWKLWQTQGKKCCKVVKIVFKFTVFSRNLVHFYHTESALTEQNFREHSLCPGIVVKFCLFLASALSLFSRPISM